MGDLIDELDEPENRNDVVAPLMSLNKGMMRR
jgi:hypothetical protein